MKGERSIDNFFRRSEEHYKALVEIITDAVISIDRAGRILLWNSAAEKMFGCSRDEAIGLLLTDLIVPDKYVDRMMKGMEDFKETGQDPLIGKTTEIEAKRKDGEIFPVELSISAIKTPDGWISTGIIRDISERKQAEEVLRESEMRFRQFFENEPEYCYIVSPEGVVLDVNKTALKVLGYKKEELVGKHLKMVYAPESLSKMEHLFDKWKETGKLQNEEMIIVTREGNRRPVLLSANAARDNERKILNFVSVQKDITKLKQAEQKMIEERDQAKFYLDILSHDINNFNAVILLYAQLLLAKADFPEPDRRKMHKIMNATSAMSKLITNVRKLSALKEGGFQLKVIDVCQMISEVSEQIPLAYPGQKIEINHSLPEPGILVKGNDLLEDVFGNILTNAIKYGRPEGVVIDISCGPSSEEDYWRIELKDNGPGVPDDMKERIFNRLERGGDKSVSGSGLGLTIVREVVKGCGGKVWVEDRVKGDPGQGSNFILLLQKGKDYRRNRIRRRKHEEKSRTS